MALLTCLYYIRAGASRNDQRRLLNDTYHETTEGEHKIWYLGVT